MSETTFVIKGPISLLTWLICLPFRIAAWLVMVLGRMLAAVCGLLVIAFGVLLTLTGIFAIVGIPLIILGAAIIFKSV